MALDQALELAEAMFSHFDEQAGRIRPVTSDGSLHLQCAKGCNYCCYIEVGVSPLEVIAIKNHLGRPENRGDLERVKTRIRHARKAVGDLHKDGRKAARVACPLLEADGSCGVYPVRPVACRSYASFDRDGCELDWREPDAGHQVIFSETLRDLSKHMGPDVIEAHARVGLRFWGYELIRALHIAFTTPDFERKCLSGENVLAKAALQYDPKRAR